MKRLIIVMMMVMSAAIVLQARIINIPADYSTIQAGINASANGDTVLVQPGTYHENINFNGHGILLTSLFLLAGDTAFINSTIIDGSSTNSVVTFNHHENDSATIMGFTIMNGHGENGGGGVYCDSVSPVIAWNNIYNNTTGPGFSDNGGGIFCLSSNPKILYNIIRGNMAGGYGGGISCANSNPYIGHNVIYGNTAFH